MMGEEMIALHITLYARAARLCALFRLYTTAPKIARLRTPHADKSHQMHTNSSMAGYLSACAARNHN